MKKTAVIILLGVAAMSTGCATISEESCIAQSWESLGYEDGRNGKSRGHFSKIAETCTKYGITANASEYRLGYDQGLPLYCSYDRGVRHGEDGKSLKTECREIGAAAYFDGFEEGRVIYEIRREYNVLIDNYRDLCNAINDVTRRLAEDELAPKERKRLRKKLRRLEREADDRRIDIRAFEQVQGWPRQNLDFLD